MEREDAYRELRPLLFSIAYQMVGSVSEAEDLVQEAFLRFHDAVGKGVTVDSPKAYLSAVTTRLAVNHLRSARVRRERYVGTWLPEPLLTGADATGDAAWHAETADSLSMAFLVLLESLSPVERAVFLLREVFGYRYEEIAPVVGRTEDNCRQLAARARRHVGAGKPRFESSRAQRDELARRFLAAVEDGDVGGLTDLLTADVVMHGDGGGKAPAIVRPVHGRARVTRLLLELSRQLQLLGVSTRVTEINGHPGALASDRDGRLLGAVALDIAEGRVQTVRSIVNPDKLRHLGPVGDLDSLFRGRRGSGPGDGAGSPVPELGS